MPSTSKKQHNFMAAIAHSPSFAKKAGVPMSVGKDFVTADKGKKFSKGGDMKKGYADGGMTMVNKGGKMVPSFAADGIGKMKKGGMTKSDMKEDMKADLKQDKSMMQKAVNKHEGRLHKGATMTKLASGGMAPSKMGAVKVGKTPDGVATKGKTKGTMIAMKRGGKC
jgi:hypothetical protein